eukprot:scaffold66591_cov73-Cyclotella_meneghiniana.AAC.6
MQGHQKIHLKCPCIVGSVLFGQEALQYCAQTQCEVTKNHDDPHHRLNRRPYGQANFDPTGD